MKDSIGGWVYEYSGDGGRESRSYRVFSLLVAAMATVFFLVLGVQDVWGALSGTPARIELVHCGKNPSGVLPSSCTGVWRPTGETEKKVDVEGAKFPKSGYDDTMDAHIRGDTAYTNGALSKGILFIAVGLGSLGFLIFSIWARRLKSVRSRRIKGQK